MHFLEIDFCEIGILWSPSYRTTSFAFQEAFSLRSTTSQVLDQLFVPDPS